MKINQKKVNERLENVDPKHRVFIYDGSLIIEFLRNTFMPIQFLLPNVPVKVGEQLKSKEFKDLARGHKMLMRDLYHLYLLWREEKDYTKKIESRYIFSLVVRHLRLYKNGWELNVYRVGRDQIWYAGPLMLRTDVPKHLQTPAPEPPTASESEVEANPIHDPSEDETPQEDENEPEVSLIEDIEAAAAQIQLQEDQIHAEMLENGATVQYTPGPTGSKMPDGSNGTVSEVPDY